MLDVPVSTLRNWEQGRRHPRGPAMNLLRIAEQRLDACCSRWLKNTNSLPDRSTATRGPMKRNPPKTAQPIRQTAKLQQAMSACRLTSCKDLVTHRVQVKAQEASPGLTEVSVPACAQHLPVIRGKISDLCAGAGLLVETKRISFPQKDRTTR